MGPSIQSFCRRKLVAAREVRGLTKTALAEMLDVTQAAVSQYESGRRTPSRSTLTQMAQVLRMPIHYFIQDDGSRIENAVFFRSMASATKKARMSATRRLEWLTTVVDYLRQYVEFPEPAIPTFDIPDKLATLTSHDIETIANSTRKETGLGLGPISNVTWLLENKGSVVAGLDVNSYTLDAFSNWHRSRPYIMLNNEKTSAVRLRYDVGHELGHMILHRKVTKATLDDRVMHKLLEDQAHYFAGAFLLPEDSFGNSVPYSVTIDALVALKPKWKVSIAAMIKRLRNLGLISKDRERRLFIGLSRKRWRTEEPYDDSLEIERPRLLRKAAELLISNNILRFQDVEAAIGIPRSEIAVLLDSAEPDRESILKLLKFRDTNMG